MVCTLYWHTLRTISSELACIAVLVQRVCAVVSPQIPFLVTAH
jgi:hypothetical protein